MLTTRLQHTSVGRGV